MDRFRTMQSFARVVRAGSFTLAAHQLGLSRALVSRHVSDLEARLGVRLLNRSTRSLNLTEEGRQYLDFCEQLFRDLETQEDTIAQARTEPAGALRVLAPNSFGTLHIADAMIAFAKTQPRLKVSLLLENTWFRQNDFSQRELDIALRFAPIRKTQMVAEPIADFDWVVCAAPEYLERRGRPVRPGDLAAHACLVHSNALPDDHIWRFVGPKGNLTVRIGGATYSNSALALRKMAMAGLGIALLPRYCVAADLPGGALETLLPRYKVPRRTLYAVYPRVDVVPKKIPLFTEFLARWMVIRSIGHPPQ
jgi:DNA-binding transcriptional LysR family regulator